MHNIMNLLGSYAIPEIEQLNDYTKGMRCYRTPSGIVYPSVSTVVGYGSKFELDQWRQRVGPEEAAKITAAASKRGTELHRLIELYVLGASLESLKPTCMPPAWNMFQNIRRNFIDDLDNVKAIEARLWSDKLKLAGTVDFIGTHRGIIKVIDWKNSRRNKDRSEISSYFMQCAAYATMWWERFGESIQDITIVMASDDNPKPIVFEERVKDWIPALLEKRRVFRDEVGL